jgi:hypothetical protein
MSADVAKISNCPRGICFRSGISTLLVLVIASFVAALKASPQELPCVQVSQEIHDLEISRESPKYVLVGGAITFSWNDRELTGFTIDQLDFLNNTEPVVQKVEERTDDQGISTVRIAFRGRFECHNNFASYPFNMPRIPILFKRPTGEFRLSCPSVSRKYLQGVDGLPQSDSYSIVGRHFMEGTYFRAHGVKGKTSTGDIMAVGLYLDLLHKPLRTIMLVLLPLIAISFVSYSSQWWKDESAASRGIMASLFAATAVAVSSISLAPNVSTPTTVLLAFCCYYITLIVLGILTVIAFREKVRQHPELFRRVRLVGRMLGPIMFLGSIIFLTIWVFSNQRITNYEWLGGETEVPSIPCAPHAG